MSRGWGFAWKVGEHVWGGQMRTIVMYGLASHAVPPLTGRACVGTSVDGFANTKKWGVGSSAHPQNTHAICTSTCAALYRAP